MPLAKGPAVGHIDVQNGLVIAGEGQGWNHNLHFHPTVLNAIATGATSALDVGTGDGMLAVDLRRMLPDVVAIDTDADVLAAPAREHEDIEWVLGDALTYDFGRTFDVVASIAVVHHFPDLRAGLERLASLTAPGGVLAVIGLATDTTARDHLYGLAGLLQHQWFLRTRTVWEHSAPTVWPPPHTYDEVRTIAAETLPGVKWQQHALWRYELVWHKPAR